MTEKVSSLNGPAMVIRLVEYFGEIGGKR